MFRSCTTIQSSHGKKCPSLRILLSLQRFCYPSVSPRTVRLAVIPPFVPRGIRFTVAIAINGSYALSLCTSLLPRLCRELMIFSKMTSAIVSLEAILRCMYFVLWGSDLLVSCNLLVVHFVSLLVDFVSFCFVLAVAPVVFVICVRHPDPRSSRFLPSPFDKDSFS